MAAKFIEYKSANDSGIVEIVANKGICWQVKDDNGDLFLVQKKHVVRGPWEETEEDEPAPASTGPVSDTLATLNQLTNAPKPAPKPKKDRAPKEPRDPNAPPVVSLKELCFDLDVIPRIARRRLRKELGNIGTGSRWEWPVGSQDLEKVKQVLLARPAPAAEDDSEDDAE